MPLADTILQRKTESESMSLEDKAIFFEERLLREFVLRPYSLVARQVREKEPLEATLDNTLQFLAALAFKYRVTGDENIIRLTEGILDSIRFFGKINDPEGLLPYSCHPEDENLVTQIRPRSNIYSHLFFAFNVVYDSFDSPEIKQRINEHTKIILEYLIHNDFILVDSGGREAEKKHDNLKPRKILPNASKRLDALVLVEYVLKLLDGHEIKSLKHDY